MIFRLTRDADLEIDEEDAKDLLTEVEASLRRRRRGDAVRLEVVGAGSPELLRTVLASVELEEKDFHGFIALCGSSPAYVFIFIEAMADAAVKLGIPRKKAYKMAAQSVLGSAKMILDTEQHPGELKDMVCSPSGTTIDAVVELEKQGFRSSIIEAMIKCADKSKSM